MQKRQLITLHKICHLLQIRTFNYGCYDEIIQTEENNKRIRRCNWSRFLSFEEFNRVPNLKCTKKEDGQLVYETLDNIPPNTDLVIANQEIASKSSSLHVIRTIAAFMQGKTLDFLIWAKLTLDIAQLGYSALIWLIFRHSMDKFWTFFNIFEVLLYFSETFFCPSGTF